MGASEPEAIDLDIAGALDLAGALDDIHRVLGHPVVGFVTRDNNGRLGIIAAPGFESRLLRMLGKANWSQMARLAEEYSDRP